MRAKPFSTIVVRVPAELRGTLDELAEARGESLALIVRDALRVAAGDRRRSPSDPSDYRTERPLKASASL